MLEARFIRIVTVHAPHSFDLARVSTAYATAGVMVGHTAVEMALDTRRK